MGVSYRRKYRHRGSIDSGKHWLQHGAGFPVIPAPGRLLLLEIHKQCELFQRLRDSGRPQGILIQGLKKAGKCLHIHKKLVCVFIPDSIGSFSQRPFGSLSQLVPVKSGKNRTGGTAAVLGFCVEMAGVCLHADLKYVSRFRLPGQCIIHQKMVGLFHPVSPVRAKR